MVNEVKEIRHDLRNLKITVDYESGLLRKIEAKVSVMNTKIYTTVSVTVVILGAIGFLIRILI